jgi:hypothetical protein
MQNATTTTTSTTMSQPDLSVLREQRLAMVFSQFERIYDWRWTNQFKKQNKQAVMQIWADALTGLTGRAIKGALQACGRDCKSVPSPAGFREMCLRALGVPSADDAFKHAIRREWVHPVVKQAFVGAGGESMMKMNEKDAKFAYLAAYRELMGGVSAILVETPVSEIPEVQESFAEATPCVESRQELPTPIPPTDNATAIASVAETAACREWDEAVISLGSKLFDERQHEEYRRYLTSLPDLQAAQMLSAKKLSASAYLDRCRFLSQDEAMKKIIAHRKTHALENENVGGSNAGKHSKKIIPFTPAVGVSSVKTWQENY